MEAVRGGLEVFKQSLPPSLAGHWAELLVGLLVFQLLVFLCEYFGVWMNQNFSGACNFISCWVLLLEKEVEGKDSVSSGPERFWEDSTLLTGKYCCFVPINAHHYSAPMCS